MGLRRVANAIAEECRESIYEGDASDVLQNGEPDLLSVAHQNCSQGVAR